MKILVVDILGVRAPHLRLLKQARLPVHIVEFDPVRAVSVSHSYLVLDATSMSGLVCMMTVKTTNKKSDAMVPDQAADLPPIQPFNSKFDWR